MQSSELRRLLGKYIDNSISAEEFEKLWKTLDERQFDHDWQEAVGEVFSKKQSLSTPEEVAERLAQIKHLIHAHEQIATQGAPRALVHPIGSRTVWYAAAALLILISGVWLITRNTQKTLPLAVAQPAPAGNGKISPGTQKAILTLADGTTIMLDSMANGRIAQQGAAQVLKLANGQIRYQTNAQAGKEVVYNVMSTPKGGNYELTLPDGTNVWLNAASSITYPSAFTGDERKVKITGEVYFEVAKDKSKPFHVTAGDQEVEVLGTHFNINAYSDEEHIKTSLLEGSVRVNSMLLRPGQAYVHGSVRSTDIDQDIAWKNGVFNFNNQTLSQVMRQLARWYDLEVQYPLGVPKKEYGGEMGRNLTLDQVLKGLENSGVHFRLNGRLLIVRP